MRPQGQAEEVIEGALRKSAECRWSAESFSCASIWDFDLPMENSERDSYRVLVLREGDGGAEKRHRVARRKEACFILYFNSGLSSQAASRYLPDSFKLQMIAVPGNWPLAPLLSKHSLSP